MTSVVAIAGGTSGWGRTLIEQLREETDKFQIIVLTRGEPREEEHVKYVQVDYDDIPALAAKLDHYLVQVVISVIGIYEESSSEAQFNLIEAADMSRAVQKFIPSEYSYNTDAKYLEIDPGVKWWLKAAQRLKNSGLQYTRIFFGAFMDFLGLPNVRTNIKSLHVSLIDTVKGRALVPGDGSAIWSLTYSYDAATFIVKLLDLDEWPEYSCCVGDDIDFITTMKEVENAYNRNLQVTHIDADDINTGKTTKVEAALLDCNYSDFSKEDLIGFVMFGGQLLLSGSLHVPREYRLDEKQLGFKPMSLREFLSKTQGGG
ncbi:hypothetical protein BGW36DRAFT_387288 [Talaromyces proteolyticus]|uniref:NAD(P)-binding domain-containing protein n=1 Tax=Talaromyces proteolyticus TaxID=1131652 RepID=A0AAD4KIC4_9EURO|nr:uncharacterized protein BGW36DRAFT_387288 [Talaromyces proteolyticus]KAH8692251.1 hypothetical protein BGW36DRAFT_387288 [Talaromyces proteolyticus]